MLNNSNENLRLAERFATLLYPTDVGELSVSDVYR
jgi:hypothetical protein